MSKGRKRKLTRDASPTDVIEAVRGWFKVLSFAVVLAFSSVLLVSVALVEYQGEAEQDRAEEREQERIDRAVEGCKLYNRDQFRNRQFAHDQLVSVFVIFSRNDMTAEEVVEGRAEEFADYTAFTAEQFPYRRCTPKCVDALVDPNANECPPAETRDG